MSNEITIVVKSRNESKPGIDGAGRDTDRLKTKARELGAEFQRLNGRTDEFGRRLQGSGNFAEFLNAKIGKLREETRRLGEEFNRTGHTDFEHLFKTDSAIKDLEVLRGRMVRLLGDAGKQGGQEMAKNLSASLQGAESTPVLGPALAAVIAGAVAAALPAINALLLSAAGLGAIGLGVAGQLHDPAVKAAIGALGTDLKDELARDTVAFREPLINAAHLLTGELSGALGSIHFDRLASELEPLARGLGGLFNAATPGFNQALEAAQPILHDLANQLPKLGAAVSDMFASFARGGPGAAMALRAILMMLEGTLVAVGRTVEWFSKLYEAVVTVESQVAHFIQNASARVGPFAALLDRIVSKIDEIRFPAPDTVEVWGRSLHEVATTADQAGTSFDQLLARINEVNLGSGLAAGALAQRMFNALMSVDQASLHWHETLTQVQETLAQNGRALMAHSNALDLNSKKGQENEAAILGAVQANMQQYQAWIQVGGSAEDAAAQYDTNTKALERQLRAAGYNQQQIDGLIGKYRGIPDAVNPMVASLDNVSGTVEKLIDAIRRLMKLPTDKEINVRINTTHYSSGAGEGGHASGGIWGGLTTLAEQGRELVRLPQGSMVLSNPDTERVLAGGMGGGGYPSRPTDVRVNFTGNVDTAFASYFMQLVAGGQITVQVT